MPPLATPELCCEILATDIVTLPTFGPFAEFCPQFPPTPPPPPSPCSCRMSLATDAAAGDDAITVVLVGCPPLTGDALRISPFMDRQEVVGVEATEALGETDETVSEEVGSGFEEASGDDAPQGRRLQSDEAAPTSIRFERVSLAEPFLLNGHPIGSVVEIAIGETPPAPPRDPPPPPSEPPLTLELYQPQELRIVENVENNLLVVVIILAILLCLLCCCLLLLLWYLCCHRKKEEDPPPKQLPRPPPKIIRDPSWCVSPRQECDWQESEAFPERLSSPEPLTVKVPESPPPATAAPPPPPPPAKPPTGKPPHRPPPNPGLQSRLHVTRRPHPFVGPAEGGEHKNPHLHGESPTIYHIGANELPSPSHGGGRSGYGGPVGAPVGSHSRHILDVYATPGGMKDTADPWSRPAAVWGSARPPSRSPSKVSRVDSRQLLDSGSPVKGRLSRTPSLSGALLASPPSRTSNYGSTSPPRHDSGGRRVRDGPTPERRRSYNGELGRRQSSPPWEEANGQSPMGSFKLSQYRTESERRFRV